jgi:serine/threonine-protein kinase
MYTGAAYVIIELSNNIFEPLNLPGWTPTLIIVLLIIGFPFAVIFSWIFDVTPEGIKKTGSVGKDKLKARQVIPSKKIQKIFQTGH